MTGDLKAKKKAPAARRGRERTSPLAAVLDPIRAKIEKAGEPLLSRREIEALLEAQKR